MMPTKRDSLEWLLYSSLAALGFILVFIATDTFGPGVSPDSIGYIAAARSLAEGRGYLNYDGSPFTLWPPLFPTILAVGASFGIDLLQFARFFNALIFGLTIFIIGQLSSRLFDSHLLRAVATGSALLSFPLLKMSVMVWTEPLFILLVLVFLAQLARIQASQSLSFGPVAALAGVVACACFKQLVETRRCIIPADGFYEWRKEGKRKVPMWAHLKSKQPFTLAGL